MIKSIAFFLSMPGCNSWNGKWSGEGRSYVKVIKFRATKKQQEKAKSLLDVGYFSYSFGDGWVAGIRLKEVEGSESRKLTKTSNGFCGYDWMVDSILESGEIKA